MAYLEELLSEFRKGAKIKRKCWVNHTRGIGYEDVKNSFFNLEELCADDWELVENEPINWDYIIANKYLCWFWDRDEYCKIASTLLEVVKNNPEYPFYTRSSCGTPSSYKNCRPVRKDEITIYEEIKE